MQRDELKDLVKDEDALNKIMAMHGKDVTKFKEQQSELETKVNSLSENLTAANKQLEDVKQSADDEIKAKISAYQGFLVLFLFFLFSQIITLWFRRCFQT